MDVIVIGIESRVGQSKTSGADYAMYIMKMLLPISPGQSHKVNANNVHKQEGFVLVEQSINEVLQVKLQAMNAATPYPFHASVELMQTVGRGNALVNECLDVKPIASPPILKSAKG